MAPIDFGNFIEWFPFIFRTKLFISLCLVGSTGQMPLSTKVQSYPALQIKSSAVTQPAKQCSIEQHRVPYSGGQSDLDAANIVTASQYQGDRGQVTLLGPSLPQGLPPHWM